MDRDSSRNDRLLEKCENADIGNDDNLRNAAAWKAAALVAARDAIPASRVPPSKILLTIEKLSRHGHPDPEVARPDGIS